MPVSGLLHCAVQLLMRKDLQACIADTNGSDCFVDRIEHFDCVLIGFGLLMRYFRCSQRHDRLFDGCEILNSDSHLNFKIRSLHGSYTNLFGGYYMKPFFRAAELHATKFSALCRCFLMQTYCVWRDSRSFASIGPSSFQLIRATSTSMRRFFFRKPFNFLVLYLPTVIRRQGLINRIQNDSVKRSYCITAEFECGPIRNQLS